MTDKERLEEIKNSYLEGLHRLFGTPWVSMPKENFDWLIQQAERAQKNAQDLEDMDRQLYSEQQQNKRYKQALEEIAEETGTPYADLAIKALDIETKEVRTYKCEPCPTCDKWITKVYNFCPHCGQRIEKG